MTELDTQKYKIEFFQNELIFIVWYTQSHNEHNLHQVGWNIATEHNTKNTNKLDRYNSN
jgi:hypothetical protein